MIAVGSLASLRDHSRYLVSLRSTTASSTSRSIVLYALDHPLPQPTSLPPGAVGSSDGRQWHAIQEECPHLGASMAGAQLEIEDDGVVAICPWHHYDFNLRTGQSSTGLHTCTFPTLTEDGQLWVGAPSSEEATDWELVSIKPVSQRFAIPQVEELMLERNLQSEHNLSAQPSSLIQYGVLILQTPKPDQKVHLTRYAMDRFRRGQIPAHSPGEGGLGKCTPPDRPPRERSIQVVNPHQVLKRGKGGNLFNRVKLLHALANIELWAIDLAWDVIARFGCSEIGSPTVAKSLPGAFFSDFGKVAEDEAKHFTLLREALQRLGSDWGELPVHDGLWQSAQDTSHCLISRLCIIHLVHEARGLDVNPTQIKRVRDAGDTETASTLEIIHADEITHVTAGHRWLSFICKEGEPPLDPVQVFREQVRQHFIGKLKPPFNVKDRAKAGLQPCYYEDL